jgi:hypothetical protein
MKTTTLVKINEIRIDDGKYVMKSCLINPEHIITVQSGKLSKTGPHIIGQERERELRMIVMRERQSIFVDESVEELAALLTPKE